MPASQRIPFENIASIHPERINIISPHILVFPYIYAPAPQNVAIYGFGGESWSATFDCGAIPFHRFACSSPSNPPNVRPHCQHHGV